MKLYEFDSIGTHWWIELLDDSTFDDALIATLQRTADQFDQRYSRFRDDSLVSKLYKEGRLAHPPAEMLRMLEFAHAMYDVSDGAFDLTVGNDLHRMGYGKRVIAKHTDDTSLWDQIVVTPAEIIYPDGVMLDFGGLGKGWLIDQFSRDLMLAGKQSFIVNGGGDLYVRSQEPIEFSLEDPHDNSKRIGQIKIARGALAGSNTLKRTWAVGSTQKHHIIDPTTHDSSRTAIVASYVAAESALIADVMATILILRPELKERLVERYHLKAMLVTESDPDSSGSTENMV